jgi:hypothetical protein
MPVAQAAGLRPSSETYLLSQFSIAKRLELSDNA